jgi:hypothetical protein
MIWSKSRGSNDKANTRKSVNLQRFKVNKGWEVSGNEKT